MCKTAKNFGLQEENINISNPSGNSTKRDGVGLPQKERPREMYTKREE